MVKLVPAGGGALSGVGVAGSVGRVVLVLAGWELVAIVSTVTEVSADFSILTAHPSDAHNKSTGNIFEVILVFRIQLWLRPGNSARRPVFRSSAVIAHVLVVLAPDPLDITR